MAVKKLTREDFLRLFPAPSEGYAARTAGTLRALRARPEAGEGRRRIRSKPLLGIALLLTFAALGASAAPLDWGALDFLIGDRIGASSPLAGREPEAAKLLQDVGAQAGEGSVRLAVSGALTDGETLAFDWRIENASPETPVFVAVERFTGNGERLSTDGADDFNRQWLPGVFSEDGTMQGGNLCALPERAQSADALDVEMTVAVYRPLAPVYDFGWDSFDKAVALEKLNEGCIVVGEGNGFAVEDEEAGIALTFGGRQAIPEALMERFERTEFTLRFSLDLRAGRESLRKLDTSETYGGAARYTKAEISPLGLKLEMDLFDFDPKLRFELKLTDAGGNLLETPWPEGEITTEETESGEKFHHASFAWYGLTEALLPDVVSLTRFSEDGEAQVFPVRVR